MDTGTPWSTPSGGAWTQEYLGEMTAAPSMLDDGTIVYPLTWTFLKTLTSVLRSDPRFTPGPTTSPIFGDELPRYTTPACVNGNYLYMGRANGRIEAILIDGWVEWTFEAGSPIRTELTAAPGLILFGTADGRVHALDIATRQLRWSVPAQPPPVSPYFLTRVAVRGDQALWGTTSTQGVRGSIHCYELSTGKYQWVVPAHGPVSSDPATGGGLVFFGSANGWLAGYNRNDGVPVAIQTGGAILGAAASDERYVYVGSADGTFYAKALTADISPQEWQVPVTSSIGTHIVLSGGDACFGGINSSGQTSFYMLDLASAASQSARVLIEALQNRLLLAPKASRGWVAFSDGSRDMGRLYAVHMDEKGMLERVVFASTLIVDQYDVSSGQATPMKPAFQMSATILDEQLAPMGGAGVVLWAATPITLVCNGRTVNLGATSAEGVRVNADATGLLSLTAPADVGMPSLFLRPDFFLSSYSLEVFPDQQNLNRLAHVTGDELKNARSYDRQGVIQAVYANSSEAIASSVRNTIGRRQDTGAAKFTTASTAAPSASKRGLNAGAVPSWKTVITANSVTFQPMEQAEIEQWFGPTRQVVATGGGFASFVNNVVNGAETASSVVWNHIGDAASVVVQTAAATYEFIAETVEQAVQVMKSVIETVVTSIEKFIEWLSFLFNWDDIVATQRLLLSQVETRFDALSQWIDGQLAAGAADVHALIKSWEATAAAAFGTVPPQFVGKTPASTQQSAGPMSTIFRPAGIDITVAAQWLTKQVHANAVSLPQLPGESEMIALCEKYVADAATLIGDNSALDNLPADLAAVASSFTTLCTNPGGFEAQAMDAIIRLFGDLVEVGLELLDTIVSLLFQLVRDALRLMRTILTAKIDIPYVSDFYRAVAGSDLSLLNLVSLGLAVPTTLIDKIEKAGASLPSQAQDDAATVKRVLDIASACSYVLMIPTAALLDAVSQNPALQKVYDGITTAAVYLMQGLQGMWFGLADAAVQDWVFWALLLPQPIVFTYSFAVSLIPAKKAAWDGQSPLIYADLGSFSALVAVAYAGMFPDDYFGAYATEFLLNFLPNLPLLGPALEVIMGEGPQAQEAALDLSFVCYGTSAVLSIRDEIT